jgi:hypothetical protein
MGYPHVLVLVRCVDCYHYVKLFRALGLLGCHVSHSRSGLGWSWGSSTLSLSFCLTFLSWGVQSNGASEALTVWLRCFGVHNVLRQA